VGPSHKGGNQWVRQNYGEVLKRWFVDDPGRNRLRDIPAVEGQQRSQEILVPGAVGELSKKRVRMQVVMGTLQTSSKRTKQCTTTDPSNMDSVKQLSRQTKDQ
jgi:hypothetical protein